MKFHKFITTGYDGKWALTLPKWCYFDTTHFMHTFGTFYIHFKYFFIIIPYEVWKISINKAPDFSKGYAVFDGETHEQIE